MSFVGKSSSYYSGFSPTSIPGCALWLDAADSSSLTLSGSNVTSWRDKSGQSNTATATAGPAQNTYNGYPVLTFNGTSHTMASATHTIPTQTHTLFAVHRPATVNGNGQGNTSLFRYQNGGNYVVFPFLLETTPRGYISGADGGGNGSIDALYSTLVENSVTTSLNIITAVISSGNQNIFKNGTQQSSATRTLTTGTSASLIIGSSAGTSQFYQGDLGEMIVFTINLTQSQRQQVEGYLARKWGLVANIPATHPFKTLPPFARPFIPVDISGCSLWLDAADSSAFTLSGSNVTQWRDKSPESLGLTLVGTPTLTSNSVNFTGSQYFTNSALSLNMAAMTVFLVGFNEGSAGGGFLSLVPIANGVDWNQPNAITYNYSTIPGELYVTFNFTASSINQQYNSSVNPLLFTHVQNGTSMNVFNLGTSLFSGNINFTPGTTTGISIGARFQNGNGTASQFLNGTIKEIIIFKVALSTQQRQQVETYLANKWRLRGSMSAGHYARLAPALSTSFLPPQVGGCTLWLDGADATAVTVSGSNVTQWSDKSGNGYHFTVHPSHTSPTYSSNAINGLNGLFFQGAGSGGTRYNILYNTSIPVNGPAFSIFTVARRNATAPSSTGGNYILTDNTNSRLLYITYTSNFLLTSTANSTSGWNDITVNTPGQTLFATSVSGMVVNGSVLTPYVNGTAQNTKGGTTTSFTGLSIGDVLNANESGQTWTGFICEIMIYSIALTTTQRQSIEGYLANKWKLTASLPSGHPYKAFKP